MAQTGQIAEIKAQELNELNAKRKQIESDILEMAKAQLISDPKAFNSRVLIVCGRKARTIFDVGQGRMVWSFDFLSGGAVKPCWKSKRTEGLTACLKIGKLPSRFSVETFYENLPSFRYLL